MWTPEYFVRLVELPICVDGATVPNDDGTFDIYINALLPEAKRKAKLQHEIEHIRKDHFYIEKSVGLCEAEANGKTVSQKTTSEHKIPFFKHLEDLSGGKSSQYYCLKPDDPQNAEFAVQLHGDSMAPDFPDGCIVFCNRGALIGGDIGIFQLDTGTVCMQYYKDPFGFIYLFRMNPKPKFADHLIREDGKQRFVCNGRVITKKKYPVPGIK